MKRKVEVTFETEQTVVLRANSQLSVEHCFDCGQSMLMATPQAAAFLAGLSERHIFRLIESGAVHFTETECVRVCVESVREVLKEIE